MYESVYDSLMNEHPQRINTISLWVIFLLSFIALACVLSGYTQPPQNDEGAAAHIFQLSIVMMAPAILVFLSTADWEKPWRTLRSLAAPATALLIAFGALYYLENYRNPHYRADDTSNVRPIQAA